jgi:ferrous iron transport protein A
MEEKTMISLACIEARCSGVVYDIQGGYGITSSLRSLGITPGKKITRIIPVPVNGPISIEMDKVQVVVGFGMASRIMVKLEKKSATTKEGASC